MSRTNRPAWLDQVQQFQSIDPSLDVTHGEEVSRGPKAVGAAQTVIAEGLDVGEAEDVASVGARFLMVADGEDGAQVHYCRDETELERKLATVLFGEFPSQGDLAIAKAQAVELLREGVANSDGAEAVYLHRLAAGQAEVAQEPVASRGVISAAESLIAADRAQVLTTAHVDGLANAIAIQRGKLELPDPNEGVTPDLLSQLEAGTTIKRWIRAHKVRLNEVEFGRIDASVERLMMHLAMANAERVTAASAAAPVYRFLQAGDILHATDECIADDSESWEQVDQHYADRLAGREVPAAYAGFFRGMPYAAGMKAVRRVVTCAEVGTDTVTIGGQVYRRAGGYKEVADGRNLPVYIAEGHPDARELGERDDAIARSKRVLALVDTYTERQTADNRAELRKALMNEFTLLLAASEPWRVARAASENGPVVTLFGYFRKNGKRWDKLKGLPNPETIKTGWVPFFAPQACVTEGDGE